MQSETLIPWVMARPFEPFTAYLSDGRKIDVTHPEAAVLAKFAIALYVFYTTGEVEIVDIDHICSLRSLKPTDSGPYLK